MESKKKIACGILVLVIVVSVSVYWMFVNQSGVPAGSSATSTLWTGPPLQASDFIFNYSKCRVGDNIYLDFNVTNKEKVSVHYLNSSVTYDTVVLSNGTVIQSNQVHSSVTPVVGSVGRWHIGIPVVGFWPNGTSVSSIQVTFAVYVQELHMNLSWTMTVPVLKTDKACPKP